jgi:hypothetical protein
VVPVPLTRRKRAGLAGGRKPKSLVPAAQQLLLGESLELVPDSVGTHVLAGRARRDRPSYDFSRRAPTLRTSMTHGRSM